MNSAKTSLIAIIAKQMRIIIALTLVFSLSVGTTIVQVLGWATMIPTQLAQTGSLDQAVQNTFSGEHPCPMCKLAAIKNNLEEKSAPPTSDDKSKESIHPPLIAARMLPFQLFPPSPAFSRHHVARLQLSSLSSPPACPPPDAFVVFC